MKRAGQYRLEEALEEAEGLYLSHDPRDGGEVLVRVYFRANELSAAQRARFEGDGRTAVKLRQRNLVPLLEVGFEGEVPYAVVSRPPGIPLSRPLEARGPMPRPEAVALVAKLARALQPAHALGLIHRGIAPRNVLIDRDGEPLLFEWGLLRDLDPDAPGVAEGGRYRGLPETWSPEQARGDDEAVDARSDVYGLGALLYMLLTGAAPFSHLPAAEQAEAAQKRRPLPPSSLRAEVDAALDAVCLRCLEKDPGQRYPTAEALAQALAGLALAERPRAASSRPRWAAHLLPVVVTGVALLAAVGWVAQAELDRRATERERDRARQRMREMEEELESLRAARGGAPLPERPASTPVADPEPELPADPAERRQLAQVAFNRGFARTLRRSFPDALVDFSEALRLDPGYAKAWLNRGYVHAQLGQHERAVADFARAIELEPGFAEAYSNRGNSYQALRRYPEAIADYSRALEADPGYVRAHVNRALAFSQLGRFAEAVKDCDHALEIDPDQPQALALRGRARARLGERELALADLRRALELSGDGPASQALRDDLARLEAGSEPR